MRTFVHLLIIGVASNLDNLGVGVAYGVRRISVSPLSNLLIAGFAFLFSVAAAMAGAGVGHFLSDRVAAVAGAVLMIGVGLWIIQPPRPRGAVPPRAPARPSFMRLLAEPELADRDHSGEISLSESLVLGIAVSLNCLTNGVSAGLWKLGVLPMAVCNAALSYASIGLGVWLGGRYGTPWLASRANVLAGGILILLGVRQWLG